MSSRRHKRFRRLVTNPDKPWPEIVAEAAKMRFTAEDCARGYDKNRDMHEKRLRASLRRYKDEAFETARR